MLKKEDPTIVYYGPHPCKKCDPLGLKHTRIVKAGNGAPDTMEYDFPKEAENITDTAPGWPYPNNHPELNWKKHKHIPNGKDKKAALHVEDKSVAETPSVSVGGGIPPSGRLGGNQMVPTVGRIVYYKSRGSADGVFPSVNRAAIITDVNAAPTRNDGSTDIAEYKVKLTVFNPEGIFFTDWLHQGDAPGNWNWPIIGPMAGTNITGVKG